jgi:hypothetical protein
MITLYSSSFDEHKQVPFQARWKSCHHHHSYVSIHYQSNDEQMPHLFISCKSQRTTFEDGSSSSSCLTGKSASFSTIGSLSSTHRRLTRRGSDGVSVLTTVSVSSSFACSNFGFLRYYTYPCQKTTISNWTSNNNDGNMLSLPCQSWVDHYVYSICT